MKFIFQNDKMDCGPACLAMVCSYFGKNYTIQFLRKHSYLTKFGVSFAGIFYAAKKIGLASKSYKLTLDELLSLFDTPCILHWNNNHFVVLYKISRANVFYIADPTFGKIKLSREKFLNAWCNNYSTQGYAMFFEPSENFYLFSPLPKKESGLRKLTLLYRSHKIETLKIIFALFSTAVLTLIIPILTQSLIDIGIKRKSVELIYLILISQLAIFLGSAFIDIIRNRITLGVSSRINILIISSFLKKLLTLPVGYFDTKTKGDFTQRINDHERIDSFLTSHLFVTVFSSLTFIIFGIVLYYYSPIIMVVYIGLTLGSICWLAFFMRRRKVLDYQRFTSKSENQESIFEIINGILEIKLNGLETIKRKSWENFQIKLFGINLQILQLDQIQIGGFNILNQIKNLLSTFISAQLVISGNLTLGELLSVSFIIGQMNSPINQLVGFSKGLSEAKLSLQRLNEIEDEEEEDMNKQITHGLKSENPSNVEFHKVSFRYGHPGSALVLDNINMFFERGKTTAIVGPSGSGKTTILKLLLGFHSPIGGNIYIDGMPIENMSMSDWRKRCGTVLQEGYIFSDTILQNIICDQKVDAERLEKSLYISKVNEFINNMPLGLETKIGGSGMGLSGGQRQRILIGRAVYKDPQYYLFDEATSSLDSQNERDILESLQKVLVGKTVVIIAHRLSTVKNADRIYVIDKGRIIEQGKHQELILKGGKYFDLIHNQLELEK